MRRGGEAPSGVGCGEGVSPSPLRVWSGKGAVPLPRIFNLKRHTLVHPKRHFCQEMLAV